LTFEKFIFYNGYKLLAGEGSSLAPLPFPFSNLGASPASALPSFSNPTANFRQDCGLNLGLLCRAARIRGQVCEFNFPELDAGGS
jgi:hypothetical protein